MARKLTPVSCKYGAPMGRSNTYPEDREAECKLHLVRLRWCDYDYTSDGTYWGAQPGVHIYWAYDDDNQVELFVRATSRSDAQRQIRDTVNARFYR
jgi:hypothetical protein